MISRGEISEILDSYYYSNIIYYYYQLQIDYFKLVFMYGDDESDEDDSILFYLLIDDFRGRYVDYGLGRFDYDDYRKFSLIYILLFEEDFFIVDYIVVFFVQVLVNFVF